MASKRSIVTWVIALVAHLQTLFGDLITPAKWQKTFILSEIKIILIIRIANLFKLAKSWYKRCGEGIYLKIHMTSKIKVMKISWGRALREDN